jgi:hypothetical protein
MLFVNLLLSFTTLVALGLSLFILISGPRKKVNRGLAAYVFTIFLWLLTNLLTNLSSTSEAALFFGRAHTDRGDANSIFVSDIRLVILGSKNISETPCFLGRLTFSYSHCFTYVTKPRKH